MLKTRLGALMFLQYFVWGAWWVTLGSWLSAGGFDHIIGTTYATQGYAAVLSPLLFGALADRHVRADRLLAILHLLGAGALLWLSTITEGDGRVIGAVLLVMCLYMPTLPLSNTVAMTALDDTTRQFPAIRALGTVGWIVAGLLIGFGPDLLRLDGLGISGPLERTAVPIRMAAGASLLLGLYCLTLPKTLPRAGGGSGFLALTGLDFAVATRSAGFWIFIGCSTLIVIPLSFYYAYANRFLVSVGVPRAAAVQSLGQVAEILFMLLLPLAFARMGVRAVLLSGMIAWAVRYLMFAFALTPDGPLMWMLLLGILLHGICYDFFFVAGQVHVDRSFPADTRARAQSFLAFMTLGVGTIVGANLANAVYVGNSTASGDPDWQAIWLAPAILSAAVALLFALATRRIGIAVPGPERC